MKFSIRFTIIIFLLLPIQSVAGWIITGRFIDREGNTIFKRYFIQNNEIKIERFNLIYSFNVKTENIIIVDPENLVFVKTNFNEYRKKKKQLRLTQLMLLLEAIPENQRKEYEQIYSLQTESELNLTGLGNDSINIYKSLDTAKLLGYRTTKFIISMNGLKKQELFFTDELDISADLDINSLLRFEYLIEPDNKAIPLMASEKYRTQFKNGIIIRRFDFENGYRTEWQVNKIEQKKMPEYEFGMPDLCKELSLDEWLSEKSELSNKFYDDYE